MDGTNIDLQLPPLPISGVSKSFLPVDKQGINIFIIFNFSPDLLSNKRINNPCKNNKHLISGDGWNKYWSVFLPIPIPITGLGRVSCQGGRTLKRKTRLMTSQGLQQMLISPWKTTEC